MDDRALGGDGLQSFAEVAVGVARQYYPQVATLVFAVGKRKQHRAGALVEVLGVIKGQDAELSAEFDLGQTGAQILNAGV